MESVYLTYMRTAALQLVLPRLHGVAVSRILIMGTGRLGSACCTIARAWYPDAEVYAWSRSADGPKIPWAGLDPAEVRIWSERLGRDDEFDIVATCTPASQPLPLDHVSVRYVSVAGAVRPDRRELPGQWPRCLGQLCSDFPERAPTVCEDLAALPRMTILPLRDTRAVSGSSVAFICGNGALDICLADAAWRRHEAKGVQHGDDH